MLCWKSYQKSDILIALQQSYWPRYGRQEREIHSCNAHRPQSRWIIAPHRGEGIGMPTTDLLVSLRGRCHIERPTLVSCCWQNVYSAEQSSRVVLSWPGAAVGFMQRILHCCHGYCICVLTAVTGMAKNKGWLTLLLKHLVPDYLMMGFLTNALLTYVQIKVTQKLLQVIIG